MVFVKEATSIAISFPMDSEEHFEDQIKELVVKQVLVEFFIKQQEVSLPIFSKQEVLF